MQTKRLQWGVSAVAIAVVVAHQIWPDVRADVFTGVVLLVAALPWLTPLLKTIKLLGVLEIELRELRDQLDETKGAVKSAAIQAQVGIASATPPSDVNSIPSPSDEYSWGQALLNRGIEYERVRSETEPGTARTAAMTRVIADMLKVAGLTRAINFHRQVASRSPGERLAAIAFAHEHPSPEYAEYLVHALLEVEDTAFGQYWALRALRRIPRIDDHAFSDDMCEQLIKYKSRQQAGTDRYYEVSELLREIRCHKTEEIVDRPGRR